MSRFTEQQTQQMQAKLDRAHVHQRTQAGRSFSYIEGYQAINEANRIFGFGEWSSEVLGVTCVVSTNKGAPNYKGNNDRQGYLIAYTAHVKVTVHFEGLAEQTHTDYGYGEGIDYNNVGQAHESAIKEAVTDALKRALRHWGNPFGLALYDKEQRDVEAAAPQQTQRPAARATAPTAPSTTPSHAVQPPATSKGLTCPIHGIEWTTNDKGQFHKDGAAWCNPQKAYALSFQKALDEARWSKEQANAFIRDTFGVVWGGLTAAQIEEAIVTIKQQPALAGGVRA